MFGIFFIALFASLVELAESHGYVHSVLINGQEYPGWNPFSDPYNNPPPRIVRKVLNDGFVGSTDPDLPCHHGGNDGTNAIANVDAGTQVTFYWSYWPADHQGPVSTYMASCNGDCRVFSATNAKWFKLDAGGYDTDEHQWAADKLRANNNSWVSTIPAGLAPGQYLIRNEIVALHSRTPQFYPSCSQINVGGAGINQPSEADLVSIPGLYTNVEFPDIYSNFGSFEIPGPPPVTFGNNGSTPSTVTSPAVATRSGTQPSNTFTPSVPARPSNQCLLASRRLIRRR